MTFRVSPRRSFATTTVIAVVSWVVINAFSALLAVVVGRAPVEVYFLPLLVSAIVYALTFAGIFALVSRRRAAWVRASEQGLELAATRRDPVCVPWSVIESVGVRWPGPFTELVVTPTSMHATGIQWLGGGQPRRSIRKGRPFFAVDVGLMRPEPAMVLAEINRRLAAHR